MVALLTRDRRSLLGMQRLLALPADDAGAEVFSTNQHAPPTPIQPPIPIRAPFALAVLERSRRSR